MQSNWKILTGKMSAEESSFLIYICNRGLQENSDLLEDEDKEHLEIAGAIDAFKLMQDWHDFGILKQQWTRVERRLTQLRQSEDDKEKKDCQRLTGSQKQIEFVLNRFVAFAAMMRGMELEIPNQDEAYVQEYLASVSKRK